ncbi:glycosyltransferase family 2 protein [Streptomyces sp. NPDC059788]|uniref:glycosyltransferase family 2 protein n=1 Tax=Streptomyces sp. NPDC059788 TaxID=3346948 RepID=UPI003669FE24
MAAGSRAPQYYDKLLSALADCADQAALAELNRELSAKVRLLYLSVHGREIPQLQEPQPRGGGGASPATVGPTVRVVIPFRARQDAQLRVRNLQACLDALGHQTLDRRNFHVTLVESDSIPRHAATFARQVDSYVHHPDGGPFNKAAAVNRGAEEATGETVLCVLDADIVLPPAFLAAAAGAVTSGAPLIPYEDAFCLDAESSDRLALTPPHRLDGTWSGYLLRRPPGGCVMVTAADFHALRGFDTRFAGWGGEDRDFVNRLESRGTVGRLPGLLLHLLHERPEMSDDHDGIMRAALAKGRQP